MLLQHFTLAWLLADWTYTSLDSLLRQTVKVHSSQPQPRKQPADKQDTTGMTAVRSEEPDLLLCAASTLAHMAANQLAAQGLTSARMSQQRQSTDGAVQLGLMLSLLVYIGALGSTSAASSQQDSQGAAQQHNDAAEPGQAAHYQAGSEADVELAEAQEPQEMQMPTADVDGQCVQQGEADLEQHPCQEICLQVQKRHTVLNTVSSFQEQCCHCQPVVRNLSTVLNKLAVVLRNVADTEMHNARSRLCLQQRSPVHSRIFLCC